MSTWPTAALAGLTLKIGSGATPRGGESVYRTNGTAFIRSQNILDHRMKLTPIAWISDEAAEKLRGVEVLEGDVLINITGDSIARCASVNPDVLPARVNQHVAIVRPSDALEPRFLSAYLVAPATKECLLSLASGATRKALTKAQLGQLEVPVPPIEEQRAIAEVLGALDDKIAANTKLIASADALMHARFRAAAIDGTPEPLSASAQFVNGKAFTKDASGTGRVVIRIAELNSGIGGSTVFSDAEVADVHVARPGDILFAWSGSLTLHRWFRAPGIVNQHIFKVIPNHDRPSWLVYELVRAKLEKFKAIAANKATTMGHIQRKHLDEPVLVPSKSEVEGLHLLMDALWNKALTAERENITLAATRDALLPQLMSGRLRVRDAESTVEEVL